ncbi:MAG: RNA-binding S4 domain-containing protein [Thermosipho sp. (in: Bacteria)]|nr:RNA-binding S4 domain-containing protein [Thermosipho sp. (in: thermotogales)]MCD6105290.1 RNA-binding S4 domain-containing protein [Thermosipho sp. (in: thermotogales)]
MRLDKFLKQTRIIKRRTIAQELAMNKRIFRNGFPLKPSTDVKNGDEIEIFYGNKYLKIRIIDDKNYEILEDKKVRRDDYEKLD